MVCRRLRELHETMASPFDKVKARCLPFLVRGMKVEEMIDWVAGEVKTARHCLAAERQFHHPGHREHSEHAKWQRVPRVELPSQVGHFQ
jgi:hypothetical protein